jgi:hypothetical protein
MTAAFELILQYQSPVAAIISEEITDRQLWIIYSFLPSRAYNQPDLAERWQVDRVFSPAEWASEQLRRKPMLKPKGTKLAFL